MIRTASTSGLVPSELWNENGRVGDPSMTKAPKLSLTISEDSGLFLAEDRRSGRWWTVSAARPEQSRLVTADNGRELKSGSAMHVALTQAVEEYERHGDRWGK